MIPFKAKGRHRGHRAHGERRRDRMVEVKKRIDPQITPIGADFQREDKRI
jgi:hypothetical protein